MDFSYANVRYASNGSKFFEWVISLWVGVVVPLMALHIGHHLALLSPISNSNLMQTSQQYHNSKHAGN
jgi:hypothetical protein